LAAHANAMAIPVSKMNGARPEVAPSPFIYIWIEDGTDSLNVALIEEGLFAAGVMLDMTEAMQQTLERLRDARFSDTRAAIEKEMASTPKADRPKRLVSAADYARHKERFVAAEEKARREKKGIWSDE